jgi:hypothetical protein
METVFEIREGIVALHGGDMPGARDAFVQLHLSS